MYIYILSFGVSVISTINAINFPYYPSHGISDERFNSHRHGRLLCDWSYCRIIDTSKVPHYVFARRQKLEVAQEDGKRYLC